MNLKERKMAMDQLKKNNIFDEIDITLQDAIKKWPNWVYMSDALNIISEEIGEMIQACNQYNYENGDKKEIKKEALQSAAMIIRFLMNFDNYERKTNFLK